MLRIDRYDYAIVNLHHKTLDSPVQAISDTISEDFE